MPWIIYVYEGVENDEGGRPRLINSRYFGGLYDGQEALSRLWTEMQDYLNETYDMDAVERIYINGDGASWTQPLPGRFDGGCEKWNIQGDQQKEKEDGKRRF